MDVFSNIGPSSQFPPAIGQTGSLRPVSWAIIGAVLTVVVAVVTLIVSVIIVTALIAWRLKTRGQEALSGEYIHILKVPTVQVSILHMYIRMYVVYVCTSNSCDTILYVIYCCKSFISVLGTLYLN